jgi:hypothetical protein
VIRPRRALLAALLLLPACAHLSPGRGGHERRDLWRDAHAAFFTDSFITAQGRFARLAADHPRTHEGRESHFYLGALLLDARNPGFDPRAGEGHLAAYLAQDTTGEVTLYHRLEARALSRLAADLLQDCEKRIEPLRCETRTVVRRTGGGAPAEGPSNGASAAEVARLQAAVAERDEEIRRLREELQRIRNTLVPRRPDR